MLHPQAAAMQQPLQQEALRIPARTAAAATIPLQQRLHLLPCLCIDESRVFAIVDLVLVTHLADVDDVGQQAMQRGLADRPTAAVMACSRLPTLIGPATAFQFSDN